jgi:hypothetical protein
MDHAKAPMQRALLPLRHAHACLCNLKALGPYRCVVSFSRFFGRLMIMMASKGHFCVRSHTVCLSFAVPAGRQL